MRKDRFGISKAATALPILAIGLSLASCAHAPNGPDPAAARQAIERAATRVQSCYRSPRVPSAARQIVTRLLVRYSPDGSPIGLPVLLSQSSVTPANRAYAGAMAEAAVAAVLRCAPISLPPDLHAGGWDEFDLTFSPRGVA
jgi:hypothetical protein